MVVPFRDNLNEVLLGVLDALADSVRNLGSLTEAEADGTLAVAYNDQSCELEDSAALDGLGNAVERLRLFSENSSSRLSFLLN